MFRSSDSVFRLLAQVTSNYQTVNSLTETCGVHNFTMLIHLFNFPENELDNNKYNNDNDSLRVREVICYDYWPSELVFLSKFVFLQ